MPFGAFKGVGEALAKPFKGIGDTLANAPGVGPVFEQLGIGKSDEAKAGEDIAEEM